MKEIVSYLCITSSEYDGHHWEQTIENSPCMYHDERGDVYEATAEILALRAEVEQLRDALRNIAEETTDATAQEIADRALAGGGK